MPDLLELPAGKLDVEGEEPLEAAKRELAEEIGKAAEHWEHLHSFYTSAGFTDEECHRLPRHRAVGRRRRDGRARAHRHRDPAAVRARRADRRGPRREDADRAARAAPPPLRAALPAPGAARTLGAALHGQGAPLAGGEDPGVAIASPRAQPYEHLVLDFLAYLEFERGLSRNTLDAYRSDLLQFGEWLRRTRARPAGARPARAGRVRRRARPRPRRQGARQAGDAPAQGRLPALLPPPSPPPGPDRGRPDRAAQGAAGDPQAAAGALARRGRAGCSPSPRAPSRPRCATAPCSR